MADPARSHFIEEPLDDADRSGTRLRVEIPEEEESHATPAPEPSSRPVRRAGAVVLLVIAVAALVLGWIGTVTVAGRIALSVLNAAMLVVAVQLLRGRFAEKF